MLLRPPNSVRHVLLAILAKIYDSSMYCNHNITLHHVKSYYNISHQLMNQSFLLQTLTFLLLPSITIYHDLQYIHILYLFHPLYHSLHHIHLFPFFSLFITFFKTHLNFLASNLFITLPTVGSEPLPVPVTVFPLS